MAEPSQANAKGSVPMWVVWLGLAGVIVALTVYVWFRQEPAAPVGQGLTLGQEVLAKARPLVAARQYTAARSLLEAYLNKTPGDLDVRWLLVETLMGQGDESAAEGAVDEVLRRAPRDARALEAKGQLVRRRGGDKPEYYFRQAGASPSADGPVLASAGLALLELGHADEAEKLLLRAQNAGVNSARTLAPLAQIDMQLHRYDQAIERLERALETAPESLKVWIMLADAYKNAGQFDRAAQTLDHASQRFASEAIVWLALGDVRLLQKRLPDAAQAFEKAATFDSLRIAASVRAAQVWYQLGDLTRAQRHIDTAAQLAPDMPVVRDWRQRIDQAAKTQPARTR